MSGYRALAPRMIGRQAQLRELNEHLDLARSGAGRVVFVVGEAGVGKTRLLREFARRTRAGASATLLEGQCYDEQPAPPYRPFVDVLQALLHQQGSEAVVQQLGAWAANLAPLLPELAPAVPATRAPTDPQMEKRRLFEAIYRLLRPSAPHSLVLILEDLHWSDQSSQGLLAHLARAIERDPVLVLASYRVDELHRRHRLTHLIAQLTRERRYHEVRLAPLGREELANLLETTLEQPLPDAFVDALYARTEGNPFFVEELLKALIASGRLDALIAAARQRRGGVPFEISLALKDSILSRTTDLDPATAEVLRYAAVIGRRFDFDLLLQLTGLTEAELLQAVALLIERQLVAEERGDLDDRYRFQHALTREVVYDDLLGRERRVRHRAVLQALEELYADQLDSVVDQLAYHSLQAKELARAAGYARRAGDKAMQMRAYREALTHYETALELLETDDPGERAALTEQLAAAAAPLDADLHLRYLREAHQIYAQIGDRRKVAEIDCWIGWAARWIDLETAFAHAHAAVAAFEAEPPGRDLATAYFMLSRLYMVSARPHESIAWAEKAQPLAEACADEELAANLLNNIGVSLVLLGETQRGIALLERALDLAKRLAASTWFTGRRMYSNLSFWLLLLGEFDRAAAIAREGCEYAAEAGYIPSGEWFVLNIAELYLGHWDAADALFDRTRRYGEPSPWEAELLRRRGRPEAARQLLEQSLPANNTQHHSVRAALRCALARTHLTLGAIEQATAVMDGGIADWRTTGPLVGTEPLLGCGVEVELAAGRAEQVCELLDALSTIAERAASLMSLACRDDAYGLFAAHTQRHAAAAEHFRQAAARWQAMAVPFEEAVARRRLAESLLLTGEPAARGEAQRELAAARETFARLGAPLELAAAEALAEQHGLAPKPAQEGDIRVFPDDERRMQDAGARRSSSLVEPLTERELEVLGLIAQGHSNQQIADALIVSVGTIKKHLNNIFGKLGVTSRTQAVARARELSLL